MKERRGTVLGALALALASIALAFSVNRPSQSVPEVKIIRTPGGGIQPQTVVDSRGVLHMIYFTGDASGGDIEYVTRAPGAKVFSKPVRVNSQRGSAVAIGTVRGPQMAVGRDGRVYVVWFGSAKAEPRGPGGSTPLLFSRLNDAGTGFEPQRNLDQYTKGLDGGLSVAADQQGEVYVVWHAMGKTSGEAHRRVYLAKSTNGGKTFSREVAVSPDTLGACGCCGMRAFVDHRGSLYILYRAAAEGIHRDMTLLVSTNRGRSFSSTKVFPWKLNACPMSTDDLSAGGGQTLAAWEKAGQVYFGKINPRSFQLSSPVAAPGQADDRKHPAVSANSRGQVLLAWTEGTAWAQGGSLAWQLFDSSGQPVGSEGHAPGVPVWGMPSIFVNAGGNFAIVY